MQRDDFRNYVNQFGKNWSINNSIGKKNIDEEIEKLFEKIQDGFVGDFKSQINMLKMTDAVSYTHLTLPTNREV